MLLFNMDVRDFLVKIIELLRFLNLTSLLQELSSQKDKAQMSMRRHKNEGDDRISGKRTPKKEMDNPSFS